MNFSKVLSFPMLLLLAGFTLISCKETPAADSGQTATAESPANDGLRILDKEAFALAIKKSGAVLIDVRTPQEFEQGHIENALNINFFDPEFKYKLLDLNRNKKYYLYCKNETRSYRSMKFMEDNDFKHVYMLKDGYEGWNTAAAE